MFGLSRIDFVTGKTFHSINEDITKAGDVISCVVPPVCRYRCNMTVPVKFLTVEATGSVLCLVLQVRIWFIRCVIGIG